MRVLVVASWFPSKKHKFAGIFNLKDSELINQTHQVKVLHLIDPKLFTPGEEKPEQLDSGILLERIIFDSKKKSDWIKAAIKIRKELKSADLLHSMAHPALLPLSFIKIRVPWVHTEHWSRIINFGNPGFKFTWRRTLVQKLLNQPDEVVTVSRALADVIRTSKNPNPTVIDNEVTLPDVNSLAPKWNGHSPLKLISVGSAIDRKGPLIAVRAVRQLKEQGLEAELTWIGDGDLINSGVQLAAELGISDKIHFLGTIPPTEINEKLAASNIFVLPVISETFGVAIAEALGAGLPVVVTGTGGHHGFVNQQNGRIVKRTPEAVAAGILEVLKPGSVGSPEEISTFARERFNPKVRADAYAEVYKKAILKHQLLDVSEKH